MDFQVPIHRRLAFASRSETLGVNAIFQVNNPLLETLRDSREVLFVGADQRRIGFASEPVGKVECTGGRSHGPPFSGTTGALRQAPQ